MHKLAIAVSCAALVSASAARGQEAEAFAPACAEAPFRALDFWVGEWDAYRADDDALAGRSSIRREDGGCVITEHWESEASAYSGRSLNLYDAQLGKWRQFWVDSTGDVIAFEGEIVGAGVRFTAAGDVSAREPAPHVTRMTLTRSGDGTVLQHGESSADGVHWTTRYMFIYRPRG